MPYCCNCGTQVGASDPFCGSCGSRQPGVPAGSGPQTVHADAFGGISARHAALFCYIPWLGWIAAILVLASDRFRRDYEVRFHAFQGLYLFVAWLIVDWVISPVLSIGVGYPFPRAGAHILNLLILAGWIVMLVKVSHSEHYRLPIVGDLAERSVAEQRT